MCSLLLFACLLCATPEAPPLPEYRLFREIVDRPVNPAEYLSETSSWKKEDVPQWHNTWSLRFPPEWYKIPMGQEVPRFGTHGAQSYGVDPNSIEVSWADSGEILQASWVTHNVANGHHTAESLVFLVRGKDDFGDERWMEAFRTSYASAHSAGWEWRQYGRMALTGSVSQDDLVLRHAKTLQWGSTEHRVPFSTSFDSDGKSQWVSKATNLTEWPCSVKYGKLVFEEGREYLDPGEGRHTVTDAAMHLLHMGKAETEAQRDKVKAKEEELRRLNPSLGTDSDFTGRLLCAMRPPYEPHPGHVWNMLPR